MASINRLSMIKFMWKNILTCSGMPRTLVIDNDLQFSVNPFRQWCEEYIIQQRFTSVAHPHANGKTEVSNRTLVVGIKKRLGKKKV